MADPVSEDWIRAAMPCFSANKAITFLTVLPRLLDKNALCVVHVIFTQIGFILFLLLKLVELDTTH